MRLPFRAAAGLLLAALCASTATAADVYVDVANGDDANTGAAPNDAFRTITHAIATTTNATTTRLLLAPGTYSTATGETFRLELGNRSLIGLEGSAVTHLDGAGTAAFYLVWAGDGCTIQGLSLRNCTNGIAVLHGSLAGWELRDLHLRDFPGPAISYLAPDGGGPVAPGHLVDVHVRNSQEGFRWVKSGGSNGHIDLLMEDCTMNENSRGARFSVSGYPGWSDIRIRRCEFVDNHTNGLLITPSTEGRFEIEDNVFADNNYEGCFIWPWGGDNTEFLVRRNTSVGNNNPVVNDMSANGIYVRSSFGTPTGDVAHNICWDNFTAGSGDMDMSVAAGVSVHDNIVGAGPMVGSNGNVSVDPRFLDPANGDYRLAGDSPAIDAIPGAPAGLDVYGLARDVDGDFDAVTQSDYGAIEYRPLWCDDEVPLGGTVTLELYSAGPGAGSSRVFGARATAFTTPLPTPFGDLYIHRVNHASFGAVTTSPSSPGIVNVPISNHPWMIGQTLTFQALTTTNAGPTNWRLTNHREVLVVP